MNKFIYILLLKEMVRLIYFSIARIKDECQVDHDCRRNSDVCKADNLGVKHCIGKLSPVIQRSFVFPTYNFSREALIQLINLTSEKIQFINVLLFTIIPSWRTVSEGLG